MKVKKKLSCFCYDIPKLIDGEVGDFMYTKRISAIVAISLFSLGPVPFIPAAKAAGGGEVANVQTTGNSLSELEAEGVQLDHVFTSEVKTYSAVVPNSMGMVTLNLKSTDPAALIKVNGQTVASEGAIAVSLNTGDNFFQITVGDGTSTDDLFTLNITRKQNDNNSLQDIQLSNSSLSPAFNPSVTSYDVQLKNDVDRLTITPIAAVKTTKLKINDSEAGDKGVTVAVPVGKSTISIAASAEDGEEKTYTLNITRENVQPAVQPDPKPQETSSKKPANTFMKPKTSGNSQKRNTTSRAPSTTSTQTKTVIPKQSSATLSSLSVSSGTWNKSFSTNSFTYHISVGTDMDSVTIKGIPSFSGANVLIGGSTVSAVQLGNQQRKIIPVVVTKDNERKTYVLVFKKPAVQNGDSTAESMLKANEQTQTASLQKGSIAQTTANSWKGTKTTEQTSLWERILSSIRSFFAKL